MSGLSRAKSKAASSLASPSGNAVTFRLRLRPNHERRQNPREEPEISYLSCLLGRRPRSDGGLFCAR